MKKLCSAVLLLFMAAMSVTAAFAETPPADGQFPDAAPETAAYEELNNACDLRKILERHTSMLIASRIFHGDEVAGTQYRYADADRLCLLSSDGIGYLDGADQSVLAGNTFSGGYCTYIADTEETYRKWYERDSVDFDARAAEDETLYATERRDGLFVACTELTDAEKVLDRIEDLAASYGNCEYQEGMSLRYRRVYDPATSDLLSEEEWALEKDGTERLLSRASYTYDGPFDHTLEGYPLYGYFHADGNTRNVFVTYGPGTEGEVTRKCTAPLDSVFLVYRGDQAVQELFTDPECTQLFTGSEGNSDLHLYVK